jgi:hypothetical protein
VLEITPGVDVARRRGQFDEHSLFHGQFGDQGAQADIAGKPLGQRI